MGGYYLIHITMKVQASKSIYNGFAREINDHVQSSKIRTLHVTLSSSFSLLGCWHHEAEPILPAKNFFHRHLHQWEASSTFSRQY
jgi:hypothetical protein